MTEMNCVGCGKPIDYEKTRNPRAFDSGTNNKHQCEKFNDEKPKGFPKKWTKKEFKPIDNDLEMAAVKSDIAVLKEEVAKHDDAIRALVHELSFKKGTEVEMRNPEEVQK